MDVDVNRFQERELYGFGQNACGELGLGDTLERHTPTLSQTSRGKDIVDVTAGNELTAVLTNTGEVYSCGYNCEGQCGIGEIDETVPETVPSLTKVNLREPSFRPAGRVSLVHSGNGCEHLVLVTEEGKLQTCGRNDSGQLGHGEVGKGYSLPRPVAGFAGYRVTKVKLSGWGQLGHGEVGKGYSLPRPVAGFAGYRVTKVACSYSHTVVVTDDDRTWTFGGNDYGQLGHGDRSSRSAPAALACFQGLGVLSVACGVYHTVCCRETRFGRQRESERERGQRERKRERARGRANRHGHRHKRTKDNLCVCMNREVSCSSRPR
ncbi:unnamed protein product [Ectocarpus sp. CCAP 1310/34]|nr:unnamed protein product [Ectocarpus sp. CCAP 1310/34]